MNDSSFLHIFRLELHSPTHIGTISRDERIFVYAQSYLEQNARFPLSVSLPIGQAPFPETQFRPYFEGLLPEATARTALAGSLGIREEDYLSLLEACGKDCIGDLIVVGSDSRDNADSLKKTIEEEEEGYAPLSNDDMRHILSSLPAMARQNATSSLSLAGAQGKVGLSHLPNCPIDRNWLRPLGFSASSHILKRCSLEGLAELEYICMSAARTCGIPTATTALLTLGGPIVCSERFDRHMSFERGTLTIKRLHQEDFAQAFGVNPASKYTELPGGTVHSIARFLRNESATPLEDISRFVAMLCYCYLIGNCDNHLKNVSISHGAGKTGFRLAPFYDLVSTTYYARFSTEMGMALGGERKIERIEPEHFLGLADDLELKPNALKRICRTIANGLIPAIRTAANEVADRFPAAPYIADDLEEDCSPRIDVVSRFCL